MEAVRNNILVDDVALFPGASSDISIISREETDIVGINNYDTSGAKTVCISFIFSLV